MPLHPGTSQTELRPTHASVGRRSQLPTHCSAHTPSSSGRPVHGIWFDKNDAPRLKDATPGDPPSRQSWEFWGQCADYLATFPTGRYDLPVTNSWDFPGALNNPKMDPAYGGICDGSGSLGLGCVRSSSLPGRDAISENGLRSCLPPSGGRSRACPTKFPQQYPGRAPERTPSV